VIAARLALAAALVAGGATGVEAACTISATGVSFGAYDVYNVSSTDSTGSVTYRCGNTDKDITITISKGSSSTFSPRTLKKVSESLNYNLFRDAGYTLIWGDGTLGTSTYFLRNPPNNTDVVLTVYARTPAAQDVSAGSYSDSVVVTIEY
jgi:spore coat protein U-like protein